MFEGIAIVNNFTSNVSFLLVFFEGILSFFSPCVIPLIPIYMGYLAGHGKKENEDGSITYERKTVFFYTLFFLLGISFAFLLLGMSFTALGSFFASNKLLFTRLGGILIIIMGLFQLGVFQFRFLQKERKFRFSLGDKGMNPFLAFLMGFTFSFAWTPCIGPALSSVLIMASGASTVLLGNILVLVYALGFLIPFLVLGLFTTQALNFLKKRQQLLKYTIKTGGIILIIMGIMTYTGWLNGVSGYLNTLGTKEDRGVTEDRETEENANKDNANKDNANKDNVTEDSSTDKTTQEDNKTDEVTTENNATEEVSEGTSEDTTSSDSGESEFVDAFDFTLYDQYGEAHTLSDYKGKVVFLNFWATWCPPCKKELPDIEALYEEYGLNQEEVVFLGITNPASDAYPNNQDGITEEITSFIEDNEYTFPTLFDESGEVLAQYGITAFPTTFMINKDGKVVGYVPGMMTRDIMESVITQTLESTE